MRREVGILLTVAGAALVWLLKKKIHGGQTHERHIRLTPKHGGCGIETPPSFVQLNKSRGDQLQWIIHNRSSTGAVCDRDVLVSMGRWKQNGVPVEPPVLNVQGGGLSAVVPPHQTRPIRAKAKHTALGTYAYEVEIDGQVAIDPMIEIVV